MINYNSAYKIPQKTVAMAERSENCNQMVTLHKILFVVFAFSLICKYYSITTIVTTTIEHPEFSTLGPHNTTEILVEDTYDQLIDVMDFKFIVNPPVCQDYPAGLLLMVIVSSNPKNFDNRMVIRSTWGQNTDTMKVVFLVGETDNSTLDDKISEEIEHFGDIVQGTFTDAYRNMTYKHVMGLKWVAHHCPKAKYVLKTDDDVLVYSKEMGHFIVWELSPWGARDLIACHVIEKANVQRLNSSKWMVSKEEYSSQYYPTYCAGWAILYSQDVVARLLKAAQSTPYFWIDDVHITGTLAERIGVGHTSLSSFVLNEVKEKILTMIGSSNTPLMFGPPDLSNDKIVELWGLPRD